MSHNIKFYALTLALLLLRGNMQAQEPIKRWRATGNPIIRHKFTADPAPLQNSSAIKKISGLRLRLNEVKNFAFGEHSENCMYYFVIEHYKVTTIFANHQIYHQAVCP